MPQLNPYLNFAGNCREAMTFYQGCLGGQLTVMTFADSPMGAQTPAEKQQFVMHSNLVSNDFTLMASDAMQGEVFAGNSVGLSLNCHSDSEIDTCFSKLAEGGTVTVPLGDQFWGAKFGMLTDKFGFRWMLNYDRPQQA